MVRVSTKIFNYLHNRFPDIPRLELKEASIELSEVLKPEKKAHPLFNSFVEMFDRYGKEYNKEIIFTPRTGKAINEIIFKLTTLVSKKNPNFHDEDILNSFELILANLPEFYLTSFDIVTISNKLDAIINSIKSDRKKSQPINTDTVADLLRHSGTGNTYQ